jgi:hypothetical protein
MGSVGAVMLAMLVDEERLRKLIGKNSQQQLGHIQSALDELVENVTDFSTLIPGHEGEARREDDEPVMTPVIDPRQEVNASEVLREETDPEAVRDAFGNFAPARKPAEPRVADIDEEDDDELLLDDAGKKDKNARTKRRQLVFDEKTGEVVSKRKRKGNRNRNDWGSDEF